LIDTFWTKQMENNDIGQILERFAAVHDGIELPSRTQKFRTYSLSNFRGGIGKTTLSFNLAYELSRAFTCLFLDTCSQRNFSQNIFGDSLPDFKKTIYDALVVEMTGAGNFDIHDILAPVKPYCPAFKGNKPCFMVPGSSELFLFPSLLYSQLAQYQQLAAYGKDASARALQSVLRIIEKAAEVAKPKKILIDTSPFFGGATHLSWVAADALIIPVRVDQYSVDAMELTLDVLDNPSRDFHKFNQQAGIEHQPKVHAVVMTHCGWNRQKKNTPDSSTIFFVNKALEIAKSYAHLFSEPNISDCFYLLDDFHSSGRISGNQRIPLSLLQSGRKYLVDGQRLEVNPAVDRYKKEIIDLTLAL
jgi:chromosome partitioning protein